MSGLASLFSGMNFQGTIQRFAADNGWKVSDINSKQATLRFTARSGNNQTLYIIRYDTTLEFSVPSAIMFNSEDQIPHYLSTILLKRNAQRKVGFWCIEEIQNRQVFSCMHNAELQLIDSKYFRTVVLALVEECDEFEQLIARMLRS
ncbi:hypothetical protein [Chloroflexus sp.]|uniref:hypothetical protein n=1 Tax=Chloroflexus sp. TaxID=1904827 RepID=UPI002ACD2A00|nr:hypothetical protein [Chloroflexus sp.]